MPSVKKGEGRNEYVSRCVSHVMKNEGLDQKAAVGKCEGMYTSYQKKRRKAKAENADLMNKLAEKALEIFKRGKNG